MSVPGILGRAVPGPARDLLRPGLSLATGARGSDLPGPAVAAVLGDLVDGHREGLLRREDPHVPRDEHFWPMSADGRHAVAALVAEPSLVPAAPGAAVPQDLEPGFDGPDRDEAGRAAVVGHAHGRRMSLGGGRAWLWTAVVELLGQHERGRLAHRREHVLAARG